LNVAFFLLPTLSNAERAILKAKVKVHTASEIIEARDAMERQPRRREASRTAFWAGILLLVLIGLAIFVACKLASSMIGV
jgi:hypothetical protein